MSDTNKQASTSLVTTTQQVRPGPVRVISGANESSLHLEGKAVGAVRRALHEAFNLTADAQALVDGTPVSPDHLLEGGEVLEFVRPLGTNGVGALLTPEQLRERWSISEHDYEELLILGLPLLRLSAAGIRHSEVSVNEFFRHLGDPDRRPTPELVGTPYVADRLGVTETWVAQMIKRKEIPPSCVAPGTGNGKPWKLLRVRIDEWLKRR